MRNGGLGAEALRRPVMVSSAAHVALAAACLLAGVSGRGSMWGGGPSGAGVSVRLVSAASVPLPAPTIPTSNKVANEDPGLHYPEPPKPAPKPAVKQTPPPPEKAVELPSRNARKVPEAAKAAKQEPPPAPEPKPSAQTQAESPSRRPLSARVRNPEPPNPQGNEIPYGRGGPAQGPYGMFQSEAGSGGFEFGDTGGNFGQRYGWYVTAIRNRISGNWLLGTVDPAIRSAPRVYVAFQILRDGRLVNIQLTTSSGVPSLDRSALRAVYDSSPMPPLPPDYTGSSVTVEFWFDFQR